MAEPKRLNTRIIHKHATAAVWDRKSSFIPLQAELIVYDKDDEFNYERYKIGDGSTPITDLPFLVNPHTHTFEGNTDKAVATYTPTGSVTVSHTPKGTISKTVKAVTPTTKEAYVLTSEGTAATYVPGSCKFPELVGEVSGGVLTLQCAGGSFTPGKYTAGSGATTTKISYVESVVTVTEAPVFTGTQETLNGTFTGTPTRIEAEYTPSGTISNPVMTTSEAISTVLFNGQPVEKVVYNDTEVEKIVFNDTVLTIET